MMNVRSKETFCDGREFSELFNGTLVILGNLRCSRDSFDDTVSKSLSSDYSPQLLLWSNRLPGISDATTAVGDPNSHRPVT